MTTRADEVGPQARQLPRQHPAETPTDEGDRRPGLDDQRLEPRQEPRERRFGVRRIPAQPPAARVEALSTEVAAQRPGGPVADPHTGEDPDRFAGAARRGRHDSAQRPPETAVEDFGQQQELQDEGEKQGGMPRRKRRSASTGGPGDERHPCEASSGRSARRNEGSSPCLSLYRVPSSCPDDVSRIGSGSARLRLPSLPASAGRLLRRGRSRARRRRE